MQETKGKQGLSLVFPNTFEEKSVYFPNLAWQIVVVQLKQLEKKISPSGKSYFILAVNVFIFCMTAGAIKA